MQLTTYLLDCFHIVESTSELSYVENTMEFHTYRSCDTRYLRFFLQDAPYLISLISPVCMGCDSTPTRPGIRMSRSRFKASRYPGHQPN